MTIANISILLLFSVICAVASYCYHIDARQESGIKYYSCMGDRDKFEHATFVKVYARIIWSFILLQVSIACLFAAAYIAWVAYV